MFINILDALVMSSAIFCLYIDIYFWIVCTNDLICCWNWLRLCPEKDLQCYPLSLKLINPWCLSVFVYIHWFYSFNCFLLWHSRMSLLVYLLTFLVSVHSQHCCKNMKTLRTLSIFSPFCSAENMSPFRPVKRRSNDTTHIRKW